MANKPKLVQADTDLDVQEGAYERYFPLPILTVLDLILQEKNSTYFDAERYFALDEKDAEVHI